MLRWTKEAHAQLDHVKLMRDDQPDGVRELNKREDSPRKINIKIRERIKSDKIYKPIGTDRYVDYDTYSSSGLMLFTSSLMFGCCTLANR